MTDCEKLPEGSVRSVSSLGVVLDVVRSLGLETDEEFKEESGESSTEGTRSENLKKVKITTSCERVLICSSINYIKDGLFDKKNSKRNVVKEYEVRNIVSTNNNNNNTKTLLQS